MFKILVVDDSAFMRQLIKNILEETGIFEVTVAQTPLIALDKIQKQQFDAITVDYEMPYMNGIELIKLINFQYKNRIIMISAYTYPETAITLEALNSGAFDYVLKPTSFEQTQQFSNEIVEKLKAVCLKNNTDVIPQQIPQNIRSTWDSILGKARKAEIVGIGISTGGPPALERIFINIRRDFHLPILIVQHMPPNFTKALAERLSALSQLCIKEAEDNEEINRGCVYIAKGGYHLAVENRNGKKYTKLLDTEKVTGHKPSANVLFSSIADVYAKNSIGIIMTGMGGDGSDGLLEMRNKGALTIAQDEKSCVVFGMPKVAIDKGAVDIVLSLESIIEFLNSI
ncbi:chemotaxis response regulator protein-glutamate methylesterase [Caldicellulosiruptoraceae bacterium PP1]